MPTQRLGGVRGSALSLGGPGVPPGGGRGWPRLETPPTARDRNGGLIRTETLTKSNVEVKDQGVVRDRVGRIIGVSSLYI